MLGLWYPIGVSLNSIGYSDTDFSCCKLDSVNIQFCPGNLLN